MLDKTFARRLNFSRFDWLLFIQFLLWLGAGAATGAHGFGNGNICSRVVEMCIDWNRNRVNTWSILDCLSTSTLISQQKSNKYMPLQCVHCFNCSFEQYTRIVPIVTAISTPVIVCHGVLSSLKFHLTAEQCEQLINRSRSVSEWEEERVTECSVVQI